MHGRYTGIFMMGNKIGLHKLIDKLKEQFGTNRGYADPDIDTPWIEDGDWVNGKVYHGPDIW